MSSDSINSDQIYILNGMNLSSDVLTYHSCATRPGVRTVLKFVSDNGRVIHVRKGKTGLRNGYDIVKRSGSRWKLWDRSEWWVLKLGDDVKSFFLD